MMCVIAIYRNDTYMKKQQPLIVSRVVMSGTCVFGVAGGQRPQRSPNLFLERRFGDGKSHSF